MRIDAQLASAVRTRQAVLFVGAGVSQVLGLPLWKDLIHQMANDLDFDPQISDSLGDNYELAEYYINKLGIGKLRSWMDVKWHDSKVDISTSDVHRLLVELKFPIIFTTNYDRWLEKAHDHWKSKYVKIATIGDLAGIKDDSTQIVKLHGDLEHDESLVLSESSYFDRFNFEHPLDIKLRSDILGKTVLFLGYSLRDLNIRYLLYKLQKLWDRTEKNAPRPKSFVFMTRPNIVQQAIFEARDIKPILSDAADPTEGLLELLHALKDELK